MEMIIEIPSGLANKKSGKARDLVRKSPSEMSWGKKLADTLCDHHVKRKQRNFFEQRARSRKT